MALTFNLSYSYDLSRLHLLIDEYAKEGKRVELREVKPHRSLRQNAIFHLWVRVIVDSVGYSSFEECKTDVKRYLLGQQERVNRLTGEIELTDYKTSEMSAGEMNNLLDKMKTWALQDLGVTLPSPNENGYRECCEHYGYTQ